MAFGKDHELHQRRASRNWGLFATLVALVAIVFGMTVAKILDGDLMEAYDYTPRASELPITEPRP